MPISDQAYLTTRKQNKKFAVYDLNIELDWVGHWIEDDKKVWHTIPEWHAHGHVLQKHRAITTLLAEPRHKCMPLQPHSVACCTNDLKTIPMLMRRKLIYR
jgi:hypothetical protein